MWVIQCKTDPLSFWSNTYGWVAEGYDTFSSREKETLNLPIDGKWVGANRARKFPNYLGEGEV